MASPSEAKQFPKINQDKLSGYISRLESTVAKQKPGIINEARSYLLSHPSLAIEGIKCLADQRTNRNAVALLESLQPDNIVTFISDSGKKPRRQDFLNIFEFLDHPEADIAQAMIIGYLLQPTRELAKAEKMGVQKQQEAALKANQIGYNLAEALLETPDENTQVKVMEIVDQTFTQPTHSNNLFIDFLIENSKYALSYSDAARADEVLRYLNHLSLKTIGVDIVKKYSSIETLRDLFNKLTFYKDLSSVLPNKQPPLKNVWNNPKDIHHHSFERTIHAISNQLSNHMENSFGEPFFLTADEPQTTKIGAASVSLLLQYIGETLSSMPGDFTWRIISGPQGRKILLVDESYIFEEPNPERWIKIHEKILEYINKTDPDFSSIVDQNELETILEFTKPPSVDDEYTAAAVPLLIQQAQGGLQAISKCGISAVVSLKEEEYLGKMGLNKIYFRQDEDGMRVVTDWKFGQYAFSLDKNYNPLGLGKLSDANRNWLLTIVFSYLKSIKNRDTGPIIFLNEPDDETTENEMKDEAEHTPNKINRIPFLRVLALGDRSHEISNPIFEKEVKFHWGIGLGDLNGIFLAIQENYSLLTDPDSEINKYLDSLPYGQSVRMLLDKLVKKAQIKKERSTWQPATLNGEPVMQLRPTFPPEGYNFAVHAYAVTFVRETELAGAKPREINCPGTATNILNISTLEPSTTQ